MKYRLRKLIQEQYRGVEVPHPDDLQLDGAFPILHLTDIVNMKRVHKRRLILPVVPRVEISRVAIILENNTKSPVRSVGFDHSLNSNSDVVSAPRKGFIAS